MQNRGFIIFLAILFAVLCLFSLSFTLVSRNVEGNAEAYSNGDAALKKQYLDSMWSQPVYDILIANFTYKEVKEKELNLGLDLQGGMHVTLEVSPIDILKSLSNESQNEHFQAALAEANKQQASSQDRYVELFFDAYKTKAGEGKLKDIFATSANSGKINFRSSDKEVEDFIRTEVDGSVQRAFEIIRTRVDKFGVTQPNVQLIEGTSRIQVELPGVSNVERVRDLLQGVAKLEFWEVYQPQEYQDVLTQINTFWVENRMEKTETAPTNDLTTPDTTNTTADAGNDLIMDTNDTQTDSLDNVIANEEDTTKTNDLLADADTTQNQTVSPLFSKLTPLSQTYFTLTYEALDTSSINKILNDPMVKSIIPKDMKFFWGVKPDAEDNGKAFYTLHVIKTATGGKSPMTGEVVTDARQDINPNGQVEISLAMNGEGARLWRDLTGKNVGRQIAIVLDDYVYSAPNVNEEIGGGRSSISGSFTVEEAKDLANILKAGKLPAPTRIVEEAVVGPSLGAAAQDQGIYSILVGLLLVVIFMIVYYAKAGIVANIALLANIFFIFGLLSQLGAALTLPGIAGIVLTIGMSVDANVLIFERIREELAMGKSLMIAIEDGFQRALITIIDANVTTLITSVVLYVLGAGPIKGFAVTLIIGIICSFFTAVYISRLIIYWMSRKGDESNMSFSTPFTKNMLANTNFNFLGKRKIGYALSGVLIAVGIGVLATKGLNMGVDFTGGRSYVVEFSADVIPSEIEANIGKELQTSLEVKSYDGDNKVKITTSYRSEEESTDADVAIQNEIMASLGDKYIALNPEVVSTSKVGATIADDIADSALTAIGVALILMFGYISVRFSNWRFGVGAVAALTHDSLIVLSLFAIAYLLGFAVEIDQVFVAAILTVIGYSLNDTVVVFDRIREALNERVDENLQETINGAVNQTLSRTLITSVTTLLVVLILFIFGGEALKGFSFALLIGVVVGTYSSVFVATPLVLDLYSKNAIEHERELLEKRKEKYAQQYSDKAEMAEYMKAMEEEAENPQVQQEAQPLVRPKKPKKY
ncbi:protein translocase subunit secF [Bernardetia litoralis DSM 6794]|uniref:Multifunctional fusion protein n=1 Tax=Bernardetia litoralis (strain ATCC 23117 / DSM 6794 / NBRC 15988 / NCIMB 1366 / Fx l1 / Sio-4) TaxID=880071 RepID=I4AMT0_BERLS|nr:protein translocase subunit SecDF [Bernardetia litoralis]AFM05265.1 protein translocase subunit secF [Bernardetia litoralis DSM 6794]